MTMDKNNSIAKAKDQIIEKELWMEAVVTLQESYMRQYAEAKSREAFIGQFDEAKAIELLIEQENAKKLLQSRTANRTETFREWLINMKNETIKE